MKARVSIKPQVLRKGATIGIVSPASAMRDSTKLDRGIRYLEQLGFRVKLAAHVGASDAYLAGSDADRCADLEQMFCDSNVDAIFCTRGGYGSMRFLSALNYRLIAKHPKIFVGFSDLTALNVALFNKCGLISFSGAMVGVDLPDFDAESEEQFWRMLQSKKSGSVVKQSLELECLSKGKASGRLVCGNLSVLAALSGTGFEPDYKDSILLCEDIGEESYKVDRLLCQLELSGALKAASGLAFGQFTQDAQRISSTATRPIRDVLNEFAQRSQRCALANVMYGHTAKKLTLPYGAVCSLDASRLRLRIDEAVLS